MNSFKNFESIALIKNKTIRKFSSEFSGLFSEKHVYITSKENLFLIKESFENIKTVYIDEAVYAENPDIVIKIKDYFLFLPTIIIDSDKNIMNQIISPKGIPNYNVPTVEIPNVLNRIFSMFLNNNGFNPKLKGYIYLKYAFYIISNDENALFNIKKNIYMVINEKFDTSEESVERNIAFAIKHAFERCKKENFCESFFSQYKRVPTNNEFIKCAYNHLKLTALEELMSFI